jgi:hypothetical protein
MTRPTSDRRASVVTERVPAAGSSLWKYLLALMLILLPILWLAYRPEEPLGELDGLPPRAYIRPTDGGYDADKLVVVRGRDAVRPFIETPEGKAYPAFTHPDPQVIPQQGGKRWIFALIPGGQAGPTTSAVPPHKRPLPEQHLGGIEAVEPP